MEATLVSSTFDISAKDGQPTITREYTFKNGDTISFTVTLPRDDAATLPALHRQSIETAISHLKSLIPPR
jgi:hypothetical protein